MASHFGVDEHPFATYFDVHQGFSWVLTTTAIRVLSSISRRSHRVWPAEDGSVLWEAEGHAAARGLGNGSGTQGGASLLGPPLFGD